MSDPLKRRSVDVIAVPDEESRRRIPRPRLAELLRGPRRGRMRRDVDVDDAPTVVGEHHEDKQHTEGGGGDGEEVDRRQLGDVIREERPPRL